MKNLENNLNMIQEQINDINQKFQIKDVIINNALIENKINTLNKQLEENEKIYIELEDNKKKYEGKNIEIKNYIELIQTMTEEKLTQINAKEKGNSQIIDKTNNKKDLNKSLNKTFLNSSMLLSIKDFTNVKKKLESLYVFKERGNSYIEYEFPLLLTKNWHEVCYINNDFDIHDITYELKAVGLPAFLNFNASSFSFESDKSIDILILEIDGKNQNNYQYEKHTLKFTINLKNLESNQIHIKYKEYPNKMTEEENAFRNIYRIKEYGLLDKLMGQYVKYTLKNQSDLEIINFENEFLIKTNDNEYQWGGKVPIEGKKTKVRMSKKIGFIDYHERQRIKTIDNSFIKDSELIVPFSYIEGNNNIIKNKYYCIPQGEVKLDSNKRIYDVIFKNLNSNTAEFHLKGELKNKCNTDWIINMTQKQIDALIPSDYITNKAFFNKIANDIIKEYDKEHKKDDINV